MSVRLGWLVLVALAACELEGPRPTSDAGQLEDAGPGADGGTGCDARALLARSCLAGCHDATARQGALDLESEPLERRLYNTRSTGRHDYLLVDPDLPDESAMVLKLTSTPPFGVQMPLGRPAFSLEERACMQAWVDGIVAAGASDAGFPVADAGTDAGRPSDAGTSSDAAVADAGLFDAGRAWAPFSDDAGCAPASDAGRWCVELVVPEPLYSVRGRSANDVWAVGSRGATYHSNGTSWTKSDAGVGVTLFDVFPVAAADVWAVGERGLVLHFDGTGWAQAGWTASAVDAGLLASGQPTWDLGGVWAQGSELWVAGGGGTLARRTPTGFQVVHSTHPNTPGADLIRLYARDATEWWAVGDMSIRTWDGAAATWGTGSGAILRMFGLAGSLMGSTRLLVAVGADGRMLQLNYTDTGMYPWQPPGFSPERLELKRDLRAIWLTAQGGLGWTVGLDGELVAVDVANRRYQRLLSPTMDHLLGVWGASSDEVWAVGGRSTGVVLRRR